MTEKLLRRIIGASVFLLTLVILLMTVQPSVSFWDPGEIASASYSLMVPHPPGGPFWLIMGRIFSMIPFGHDIGYRINLVSVVSSSFSILLLYLIAIKLFEVYRGKVYKNLTEASYNYGSAAIGALAFAFCDTFWFNAVEANYFGLSTLLFSLIVWLMMVWYSKSDEKGNEKYIVLMAYLIGLSFGVHLMSVLAIFTFMFVVIMKKYVTDDETYKKTAYILLGHLAIILLIALALWGSQTSTTPPTQAQYKAFDSKFVWIMVGVSAIYIGIFWKKIFHRNSFYIPLALAGLILLITYPGIVKWFPALLLSIGGPAISTNIIIVLAIFALIIYIIYWSAKNNKSIVHLASMGLLFALLGFTTYSMIIIRSNQNPPMNENSPDNFQKLMYYLDRQQYGDFPIFKRRFSQETHQQGIYTNYSSDLDFFWNYQVNHMFNRYLLWNFVGRESTVQDTGVKWNQLFAIPFLVGLIGLYYLFKKDWKMASAWLILFIFMGYLIAFYQNQQQPQPRERFYFYPGAWMVFAVWIAVGMREIIGLITDKIKDGGLSKNLAFMCLGLGLVLIPGNMLRTNYFTHDRSHNWLPWDFSYNLLQSCKPNAILFTNGDNDTFPLWFLQDVEGVRRDVRVVCLSLANTDWYVEQLKDQSPYGALKIKFSLSDYQIQQLGPIEWQPQKITIPVPEKAIKEFGVTDTSIINHQAITFTQPNSVQFGGIKGIRVQDIVVRNIVENNTWDRPIYFASTCSMDSYIGMDDYLQMQGLASQLVPNKGKWVENVNVPITQKDLFDENKSYSKTYQPGFKFRGLNNPKVFFDDDESRLIQNYRNTYIRLAYHFLNDEKNKPMCIKTLDEMQQKMSSKVVPMDYRFLYDVGNLYYNAGDFSQYKQLTKEIEAEALKHLDESVSNIQSPYNSFSILERTYLNLKEYDKAIGILQKLQEMLPTAGGIQTEINRIKAMEGKPDTSK